jgi:DnaJ-class molecular chaperone
MAYRRNDSGCGCLLVFFIVVGILSGIRGCTEKMINGDLKMPKFGSSRVSGGSGGYGASNGYNVKYKQTTSPNYNSSSNDYTHTNSQPTEYRDGRNTQPSSTNSVENSSSRSYGVSNSSSLNSSSSSTIGNSPTTTNTQKPNSYYKTCEWCNGTGKRNTFEWFDPSFIGSEKCWRCGRSDKHRHDDIIDCDRCNGKGRIKMETINTPLGEMEVQSFE